MPETDPAASSFGPSTLYGREPVVVLAVALAGLALALGFGAHLTGEQMALVMTFTGTVLTLLTRKVVVPSAILPEHVAAAVVIAVNRDVPKIPDVTVLLPPPKSGGVA